jgi:hypothetical protein
MKATWVVEQMFQNRDIIFVAKYRMIVKSLYKKSFEEYLEFETTKPEIPVSNTLPLKS